MADMFTAQAADVNTQLGGGPKTPSNAGLGAFADLLRGVGSEYANMQNALKAKAAKEASGQRIAQYESEVREINDAVLTGSNTPLVDKALSSLSAAERVAYQSAGRRSDAAAILAQARGTQYRTEALVSGDLTGAEQIEQSFGKYSTSEGLGGVLPEMIERGELSQERLQEQLMQDLQKMAIDKGMLTSWTGASAEKRAELISGWEKEKQAALKLEDIVKTVNAESAILNLSQTQQQVRNQQMVIPEISNLRDQALTIMKDAIMVGRELDVTKTVHTMSDGSQVDSATYRANQAAIFRTRISGLRNALTGTKLPGVESISEASISYLNQVEQDVMAALQSSDQAKALENAYNSVDKKDTLALPDNLRKAKQILPFVNTLKDVYPYMGENQQKDLVTTFGAISDLVKRNTPAMISLGNMDDKTQIQQLNLTNTVAANLLRNADEYDDEVKESTINGIIGHITAANNQYAISGIEGKPWYGDFLSQLLSNKAVVEELSKNSQFASPRNKQAIANSLATYNAQLEYKIDEELSGTIRPLNKTYKLSDMIIVEKSEKGIVFAPSPTVTRPDLPAVRQVTARLQQEYGERYRRLNETYKNLTGASLTDQDKATENALTQGTSASRKRALELVSSMSEEEINLLLQNGN